MRKAPRHVLLDGYYGMGNAGDDAFCVVAANRLGVRSSVAVLGRPLLMPRGSAGLEPVLRNEPRYGGEQRLQSFLSAMRAGDIVHVGGSTMQSVNTHMRDQMVAARIGGTRLHAVAVSVGPFSTEEQRGIARFLDRFDTISVRDGASFDRIEALGLRAIRAFDVAVLLPDLLSGFGPGAEESATPVLGVSVCGYERFGRAGQPADESRRNLQLLTIVRRIAKETGASVRLIVLNRHPVWGDRPTCEWFRDRLDSIRQVEVVDYGGDLAETLTSISGCSLLIGMRLHSVIFAYALQRPFAIVAYHPKCADFAAEVDLPAHLTLPRTDIDPGVAGILMGAMSDTIGNSAALPIAVAKQRAELAFEALPWLGNRPSKAMND